jgi:hypothetical protein
MKNFTRRLGMLLVALLAFLQVSAYDFECDGFYYNVTSLDDMTVAVTYGGEYYYSGTESYVGDITIPSVASFKGRQFSVTSIGSYAFYDSQGLTSVNIPEGVTSIGSYAFYNCSSLVDFCIPDSVKKIECYAFCRCSSLKKIVIPSSVTYIGYRTFSGCTNITCVDLEEGVSVLGIGSESSGLATQLFGDCPLECFNMGRQLSHDSGSAPLKGITSLKSVKIGKYVKTIGKELFKGCTSLESITIPSNVQSIGYEAFYGTGLKTIKIEDSDESLCVYRTAYVGYYQFTSFHTDSLTDVYVGRNITTDKKTTDDKGYELFPGNVKSITIGDKVTDLSYILDNTSSLVSLQVGSGITKMPRMSSNYGNLKKLSLTATTPPSFSVSTPFTNSQYLFLPVVVPLGAKSAYEADEIWGKFWDLTESDSLGYATGITEVQVDKSVNSFVSLTADGIQLLGDAPQQVSVYGLDGREHVSARLTPNEILPLAPGTYVVRVGRKSIKVKL